mmetsp:Transcript_2327/g.5386  ORF Transcript_2327/g.5386 Transcript_2327/m.5386 type:complete len:276 (-) Transcript_2327:500-1327(-)
MPRLLQALKSIATGGRVGSRSSVAVVVESEDMSFFQDIASSIHHYIPDSIKSSLASFLGGKSQSELIFLSSILLAILLFAIILPAYETLFGDYDDCNDYNNSDRRNGYHAKEDGYMSPSSSPPSSPLRIYRPGLGVVEVEAEDVADMPAAETTTSCDSSRRSSSRSCGSSCSMETIEESEEEYEVEEEEEQELEGGESSSSTRIAEMECSDPIDDDDLEEEVPMLFTEEEVVTDKTDDEMMNRVTGVTTKKMKEILYGAPLRATTIYHRASRRSQ